MTDQQKQILAAWTAIIAAVGMLDWALDQRHDGLTLSESVRSAKDVIPFGDVVFTLGWGSLTVWFWHHIMRRKWRRQDPQSVVGALSS